MKWCLAILCSMLVPTMLHYSFEWAGKAADRVIFGLMIKRLGGAK